MVSYTITYNSKTFNWQDKMITDYIVERKKWAIILEIH
jgi:hypothetical protein